MLWSATCLGERTHWLALTRSTRNQRADTEVFARPLVTMLRPTQVFVHRRLDLGPTHADVFVGYRHIVGRILRRDRRVPFIERLLRRCCRPTAAAAAAVPARRTAKPYTSVNGQASGDGGVEGPLDDDSSAAPSSTGYAADGDGKGLSGDRTQTDSRAAVYQSVDATEEESCSDEAGVLTEAMVLRLTALPLLLGVLGVHLSQTIQLSTKVTHDLNPSMILNPTQLSALLFTVGRTMLRSSR